MVSWSCVRSWFNLIIRYNAGRIQILSPYFFRFVYDFSIFQAPPYGCQWRRMTTLVVSKRIPYLLNVVGVLRTRVDKCEAHSLISSSAESFYVNDPFRSTMAY